MPLGCIGDDDVPVAERALRDHAQLAALREDGPTGAERDRDDHELILVDQAFLTQLRGHGAAAEHGDGRSVAGLELAYRLDEIALQKVRVLPRRLDRPRGNVLAGRVHAFRDGGHQLRRPGRRPERLHHLVCLASEQQLGPRARVPADPVSELGVVLARMGPAQVSGGISEVTVDGDRLEHAQFSHGRPPQ